MKKLFVLLLTPIMMTACHKPQGTGINLADLDTTALPQYDFNQFANGGWMKNNPLPGEYSRFGTFDQLGLNNLEQVNGLIQELGATEHAQGTVEQKIGDLYRLAMDTTRRNEEGIAPIRHSIEEIQVLATKEDLVRFLGHSMECGVFAMYVDADAMNSSMNILNEYQAGYALGERDYYLEQDEHTLTIRAAYVQYIEKLFSLYGLSYGKEAAQTVLRMETRLATAALSNVELRDPVANYNKMSMAELKELVPELNWDDFFTAMEIHTDSLSVGQIRHLQEVGKMLAEESLDDWKTLFTWQVLDGAASYLTTDFFNASFEFYGKILSGKQEPTPLWKRATTIINGSLGEAVGQMYVKKYFPEENKQRMLALVKNLQTSLGERIAATDWMSDTTKQKALEKLDAFTIKIGYPDTWRDYSGLDIDYRLSYYENLQRSAKFEQAYSLSFLDKPVDKAKWYMTPQTVNAYYNPSSNEICFPAGILQPPFFNMSADDACNYGAIGVVIGHEMTHGFDDQGCQFDKEGNLNNWWTDEDKARFEERTHVMEEHFNHIEVAPGTFANGAFTLGENIADHGGLQVAFQAFQKTKCAQDGEVRDGFTPQQRFFLSYAHVWAGNIRDEEILHRTKSDSHSLGRWRVNGALPQIDAWYEAWDVTEDSPLYIPKEKRVCIW